MQIEKVQPKTVDILKLYEKAKQNLTKASIQIGQWKDYI